MELSLPIVIFILTSAILQPNSQSTARSIQKLETYNFVAGEGDGHGFASLLKACACICRKDTKFYNVSKEIQSLKQRVMDLSHKRETYGIRDINNAGDGPTNIPNNRSNMVRTLRRTASYVDDQDQIFVGFQDAIERLLAELLKAEPRQSVISIYGMGGLSKTTLARNPYNTPSLLTNFTTHTWICVSQEYNTPDVLARDMVDKCGGLPLAIVVLSGLLSHKRGIEEWQKVKAHIWRHIKDDSIEMSYILSLSYNGLPIVLKQCFLYFAIFPEDNETDAEQLMLCMAEGFISRVEERREDVAKDFLNEL
ncbi:putative disease resistance RPP13-like protein 3 [Lycium barbarum]|uniref:putative disease resistance RPP13-like protein 3 n=1 Tax=Lycium barbarum TaxID=112863 RepID=UPI00293E90D9|nr:putative disease resistance RPP13-like protein 3 [Lycium barbarum]